MEGTLAVAGCVEEQLLGPNSVLSQRRWNASSQRVTRTPGFRLMDRILYYDLILKRNKLRLSETSFKIVEAIEELRGFNQQWKADRLAALFEHCQQPNFPHSLGLDSVTPLLHFMLMLKDYRVYERSICNIETTNMFKIHDPPALLNCRMTEFPSTDLKNFPVAVDRLLGNSLKESDEGFADDGSVASPSLTSSYAKDHAKESAQLWKYLIVAEKTLGRLHRAASSTRPIFLSQANDDDFTEYFLQHLTEKHVGKLDIVATNAQSFKNISFQSLKEELKFSVSGVSTEHFAVDDKNIKYVSKFNLYSNGVSVDLLSNILSVVFDNLSKLLFCRKCCAEFRGASNLIAQTFGASLAAKVMDCELKLTGAIDEAADWMSLTHNMDLHFQLIRLLHAIVFDVRSKCFENLSTSSCCGIYQVVCQKAVECHNSTYRSLFLSFIIDLTQMYHRMVDPWLTLGVTTGHTSELVKWNPEFVVRKDRSFLTNGYHLNSQSMSSGPFVTFLDEILRCGVTMNLTRRCCRPSMSKDYNLPSQMAIGNLKLPPSHAEQKQGDDRPLYRSPFSEPTKTGLLSVDFNNCNLPTSDSTLEPERTFASPEVSTDSDLDITGLPIDVACDIHFERWLNSRFEVANHAGLELFLNDLKFVTYCEALKDIYLFGNGVFGYEICHRLCSLIAEGRPYELDCHDNIASSSTTVSRDVMTVPLPSPVLLNALLTDSLDSIPALSQYSEVASFSLKSGHVKTEGRTVDVSSLGALQFLCLNLRVPWPLNIVIADDIMAQYQQLFAFILSLNWILWALKDVYQLTNSCLTKDMSKLQSRQLHMYHFEMQHFVHVFQSYLCHQLLEVCWSDFRSKLAGARSIEDLYTIHQAFLRDGMKRCLLTDDVKYVQPSIRTILELILRFRLSLYKAVAVTPAPTSWARVLQSAKVRYDKFHTHVQFLISVLKKLENSGNQHLEDLLMRLNFNNHYSPLAKMRMVSKSSKRRSVM